jgi:plasmid maintenance system antidote protein VapI
MDDIRPNQNPPKNVEAKQDLLDLAGNPAADPVVKATDGIARAPVQEKQQPDRDEPANQKPESIEPEVQSPMINVPVEVLPSAPRPTRQEGFPLPPLQQGEFLVPLTQLVIGKSRDHVDFSKGQAKCLAHAALNPASLSPVEVKKIGDLYHVIDGWLRVMALRFQHGDTANVMVRAVPWDGSEKDAVYRRFDEDFLKLAKRKIDKSCSLQEFHSEWGVNQTVLAARLGLKESRVSKELKAAVAFKEAPEFALILDRADDPSVDYFYQVQCGREAAQQRDAELVIEGAEATATTELKQRLKDLIDSGARYSANDALVALGLKEPKVENEEPIAGPPLADDQWIRTDFVAGSDDQPAVDILRNTANRLRLEFLVDPAGLPTTEREELKERLFAELTKIFA